MFKFWSFIAVLFFAFPVAAEEAGSAPAPAPTPSSRLIDNQGLFVHGQLGVTLLNVPSNTTADDNRYVFVPAIGAEYFFTPRVGLFLAADMTSKGFKLGPSSSSTSFIDVPFGLAFSPGGSFLSQDSRNHVRLGLFYSIPTGNYSGALAGVTSVNPAKSYLGIFIGLDTHFLVAENFTLGYTFWFKYGMGSAITNATVESKFLEAGLGLVVGMF